MFSVQFFTLNHINQNLQNFHEPPQIFQNKIEEKNFLHHFWSFISSPLLMLHHFCCPIFKGYSKPNRKIYEHYHTMIILIIYTGIYDWWYINTAPKWNYHIPGYNDPGSLSEVYGREVGQFNYLMLSIFKIDVFRNPILLKT